jgi:predicted porin
MKLFTRTATAAAILTVLSVSNQAMADAKLFGKAHLSFGSVSEDSGTDTSSNAVTSHASRVGIKGAIDTEGDTKVIYRFVWQVDMSDNAKGSADNLKSREQYVGLKGSWGQLRIGRDDSPYKKAGKKNVEHLSDTWADYNNIIDKGQDTRNDDSIAYWTKLGPGKLGIQYAAGDDDAAAENAGESMNFAYDMKMGAIGFAVAYQTIEKSATNDETGTKIVFGYKLGNTQLGLISETVKDDGTLDDKNLLVSMKHKIGKNNAIKFAYGTKDQSLTDDATMTAVAFDHKLAKKISIYALLANGSDNGLNDASKLGGDGSALVVGMIAKF